MQSANLTGRIYDDNVRDKPRTHVMIIGVGEYAHGRERQGTEIAWDLDQLSSPPRSADAMAQYFINEFENSDHPVGTVTMLVSYPGVPQPKRATLANTRKAMLEWRSAFQGHPDNMVVFYFCGHGVSKGQKLALLLEDFGNDENGYEPAIELDTLRGTMKNAIPLKQLFLVDCCRSAADNLYANETHLGTRVLTIGPHARQDGIVVRQSVLFPSMEGQAAFGQIDDISVFTACFLDAVRFAGVSGVTGDWVVTTQQIQDAVGKLTTHRLRANAREVAAPTGEVTDFTFNRVDEPLTARSVVAIDDMITSAVEVTATEIAGAGHPRQTMMNLPSEPYRCCTFELHFGQWRFRGTPEVAPPHLVEQQREVNKYQPVVYVELRGRR